MDRKSRIDRKLDGRTAFGRVRVVAAALALLIPAALFAEGAQESQAADGPQAPPSTVVRASVDYLEGDVLVDGAPAILGMELKPGAVIDVGEGSLCEVVFGRNIVRIYAETTAVIDIGKITNQVSVDRGAVAAVFDKLQELGNDGQLAVRTPTAVGGVRGTVFYVRVEDEDRTFFCVCNGSVHLDSADQDQAQLVSAPHHSGLRFIRGADGSIFTEIPEMAYHTDDEMESLAARINAQIDWNSVE